MWYSWIWCELSLRSLYYILTQIWIRFGADRLQTQIWLESGKYWLRFETDLSLTAFSLKSESILTQIWDRFESDSLQTQIWVNIESDLGQIWVWQPQSRNPGGWNLRPFLIPTYQKWPLICSRKLSLRETDHLNFEDTQLLLNRHIYGKLPTSERAQVTGAVL